MMGCITVQTLNLLFAKIACGTFLSFAQYSFKSSLPNLKPHTILPALGKYCTYVMY